MVSINRITALPLTNSKTNVVQKATKALTPAIGGLAVLAGAGMSTPYAPVPSSECIPPVPGSDMYSDPLIDQLAYRADQVKDFGGDLIDGFSQMADGAGHVVGTLGGAALDTVDFAADAAATGIAKTIETVIDFIG